MSPLSSSGKDPKHDDGRRRHRIAAVPSAIWENHRPPSRLGDRNRLFFQQLSDRSSEKAGGGALPLDHLCILIGPLNRIGGEVDKGDRSDEASREVEGATRHNTARARSSTREFRRTKARPNTTLIPQDTHTSVNMTSVVEVSAEKRGASNTLTSPWPRSARSSAPRSRSVSRTRR